jgi:hypothetical protein
MAGPRHCPSGLLLAAMLGGAALGAPPLLLAQASFGGAKLEEVVVTARKEADAILTAKVEQALKDDPYVFAAHMNVVTENGVVRLEGIALDVTDMYRAVDLARRIAGKRRVVNEIELRNALWD